MAIPDYASLMLPLLKLAGDKKEHELRKAREYIAKELNISDKERKELLPSGQQEIFKSRVGWARTYLKMADLIEATRRGYFRITSRGVEILKRNPPKIDVNFLKQFPEFQAFLARNQEKDNNRKEKEESTPEEILEESFQKIKDDLVSELLDRIRSISPNDFENLVVELLLKMGYGGSRKDAGKAIGRSGDEGIDGIIKEDRLGLDTIYIQAKRWNSTVGSPDVQRFAGALDGQRSRKGIMLTTSKFSKEACDFVSKIDKKIVLIDGKQLSEFMIDFDLGVSTTATYKIKSIDSDYFEEE